MEFYIFLNIRKKWLSITLLLSILGLVIVLVIFWQDDF